MDNVSIVWIVIGAVVALAGIVVYLFRRRALAELAADPRARAARPTDQDAGTDDAGTDPGRAGAEPPPHQ